MSVKTVKEEPQPCPFCGCDAKSKSLQDERNNLFYMIHCTGYKCGCRIRAETLWEAMQRWNKRF